MLCITRSNCVKKYRRVSDGIRFLSFLPVFSGVEGLIEVGFQVVDVFQTDRETDQIG